MFKDKYKKDNELIKPNDKKINEIKNNILCNYKKSKRKTPLIIAASFLFVIFSIFLFKDIILKDNSNYNITSTDKVESTNDYSKIYTALNKVIKNNNSYNDETFITSETTIEESANLNSMDTVKSSDYSNTNVQVSGVDEADIVKSDGEYIYYLYNNYIYISKINSGSIEVTSKIEVNSNEEFSSLEMYINNNKLIVISQNYSYSMCGLETNKVVDSLYSNGNTCISIYSIENKESPKLLSTLCQDGDYSSSRIVNNKLYTITNYYVNGHINKNNPETFVPSTYKNKEETILNSEDIYMCPNITDSIYIVVTCVDLDNSSEFQSEKAILGSSNIVYMSKKNLYLSSYDSKKQDNVVYSKTNIIKFALNDGDIEFVANKSINGSLLNQFSMDENNGYLRVVTTTNNYTEKNNGLTSSIEFNDTVNNLYILDSNLNISGSIENIAKNERVYSVRFDGDIGYFVTFRETDPLFSVDLSNPNNPTILGALKIPGFSEYMHPYKDNLLLGLGKEANENGELIGLKLSMFNTSDKTNLIEVNKLVLEEFKYSSIFNNHKALTILPNKNLICFPSRNYYIVFEYSEDNGFIEKARINFTDSTNDYISEWNVRGVYADKYIYICTPNGISSYSTEDFNESSNINF